MTLDEAIKHAEEVASRKFDDRVHCIKCAEEHRQLAEWLKDYKRLLEQQPTTTTNNNEPITVIYPTIVCDDAISRQAVLDTISELNAISFYEAQEDSNECYYEIRQAIENMPPVTPQPQGHWEHGKEISREYRGQTLVNINYLDWYCSNCHCVVEQSIKPEWSYCPNCGARMVESQESEEQTE